MCVIPTFAVYKAIEWKFGGPKAPKVEEPAEEEASSKKEKKPKRKVMKGR